MFCWGFRASAGCPGAICRRQVVASTRGEGGIGLTSRSRKRPRQDPYEGLHADAFEDRIVLSRRPGAREVPTSVRHLCDVEYAEFGGLCPLCTERLAPTPASRLGTAEHVPPRALGGVIRTRTCLDCNARGASAEAELVRWWKKAYPARFATPGLPGLRAGGAVLLRETSNGKFALIVSGGAVAGVDDVLTTAGLTEEVTVSLSLPTSSWMVALLKSAYLAACIHLGEVPLTRDAQYAREVIRAGAFGTGSPVVGDGDDSVPFRVFRIYDATEEQTRSVWIGAALLPWAGEGVPIFGIGLGAVAFVTWPIPDLRRRAVKIAVGSSVA